MGFFKKAFFAATLPMTGGVVVRASTKKERHMARTEELLARQNQLLEMQVINQQVEQLAELQRSLEELDRLKNALPNLNPSRPSAQSLRLRCPACGTVQAVALSGSPTKCSCGRLLRPKSS